MKKKNAFTLIELIAVLVIMAIIALIVTPLVMSIIRKAIASADKRSVDAYGRSIDIAIAGYILDHAEFPDSLSQLTIEYSGNEVKCGVMALNEDAGAYLSECRIGNRDVKDSSTNDGWYHYEAKNMTVFDYKVGDTVTYKGQEFQVIRNSKASDATVTLLKSEPLTSAEITALGDYSSSLVEGTDGAITLGENVYSAEYSTSVLKNIVESWATTNSLLVNINDKARLITQNELVNNLKYKLNGTANVGQVSGFETSDIAWDYTSYWTENGNYATFLRFVNNDAVSSGVGAGQTSAFLRPVIEIAKSYLD